MEEMAQKQPLCHEVLEPLRWLFGSWKSMSGSVFYPTMDTVHYYEEISFEPTPKPAVKYQSRSWDKTTLKPLHSEIGFLYVKPNTNEVLLNLSHDVGINEVTEGEVNDQKLTLNSQSFAMTSLAKHIIIEKVTRSFTLNEDILTCEVFMAAAKQSYQKHLESKFKKINE